MRSILTLLFAFCALAIINAQSVKPAFITDAEIDWLNKEILELDNTYKSMQDAIQKGDNSLIAANKSNVIKSVNRLATNCKITLGKIEYANNPETQRKPSGDNPNYHYNRLKKNEKLEEVNLTNNNLTALKNNSDKIVALRDELKLTKYRFDGNSENATQNIIFVEEILTLAKSTNSIINASLAEK